MTEKNKTEEKKKKRNSLRIILSAASPWRAVSRARQTIGESTQVILDTDLKHQFWTASLSDQEKKQLAARLTIEGWFFFVVSILVSVYIAISPNVPLGLAYSVVLFLFGSAMLILKSWQAHNVRFSRSDSLMKWIGIEKEQSGE